MGGVEGVRQRRHFRWPKEVRDLVCDNKERAGKYDGGHEIDRRVLVAKLVELSGNPRDACSRFLRNSGVIEKRNYSEWTKPEQQRLLDLITTMPVVEVAGILRRPVGSVRSVLHRLGIGEKNGRDWFTKFSLSRALHTRPDEVQKWIDLGWLRSRAFSTEGVRGANHRPRRLLRVCETAQTQGGGPAPHVSRSLVCAELCVSSKPRGIALGERHIQTAKRKR